MISELQCSNFTTWNKPTRISAVIEEKYPSIAHNYIFYEKTQKCNNYKKNTGENKVILKFIAIILYFIYKNCLTLKKGNSNAEKIETSTENFGHKITQPLKHNFEMYNLYK